MKDSTSPNTGQPAVKNELAVKETRSIAVDMAPIQDDAPGVIRSLAELEAFLSAPRASRQVRRLGDALLQDGLISEQQLKAALQQQREQPGAQIGKLLVDMHAIDEQAVVRMLAARLGIPFVDLARILIPPHVRDLIPPSVSQQLGVVAIQQINDRLVVAVKNPLQFQGKEYLAFLTKMPIELVMADSAQIDQLVEAHQDFRLDDYNLDTEARKERDSAQVAENDLQADEVNQHAVVRLVNKILLDAHAQEVSDIHIDTDPNTLITKVRFRRDGVLALYADLPSVYRAHVVARIKIMSNLNLAEKRKPQDGKINFHPRDGDGFELRVAVVPTVNNLENVVLRILSSGKPRPLSAINLSDDNMAQLTRLASRPYGMILVVGPTGSGKTTTLHALLGHLNVPERKIWTAEDPVEITQTGLAQVQVNPRIGYDFAAAMRAFLRADPDVIMVGEMRDHETTKIGIEASLTGHLVLATLHTNSAPESITRLLEIGMDPFNFADSLLCILAQRLTRILCPACKMPLELNRSAQQELADEYCTSSEAISWMKMDRAALLAQWKARYGKGGSRIRVCQPKGCSQCDQTGYRGRIGVHELLVASPEIKRLIRTRAPLSELMAACVTQGMLTLKQDGIEKVLQGLTDMEQIRATCG